LPGGAGILLALLAGKEFNIQFLVGLAFSVAASANFPALLLSVVWRRFNTAGALVGVAFGLIASITLGTLLSREGAAESRFDELRVRSETGMGGDTAVARPA
jgi:cation/acetate symporter